MLDLPNELLALVASSLDPASFMILSTTCRRVREAIYSQALLKSLLKHQHSSLWTASRFTKHVDSLPPEPRIILQVCFADLAAYDLMHGPLGLRETSRHTVCKLRGFQFPSHHHRMQAMTMYDAEGHQRLICEVETDLEPWAAKDDASIRRAFILIGLEHPIMTHINAEANLLPRICFLGCKLWDGRQPSLARTMIATARLLDDHAEFNVGHMAQLCMEAICDPLWRKNDPARRMVLHAGFAALLRMAVRGRSGVPLAEYEAMVEKMRMPMIAFRDKIPEAERFTVVPPSTLAVGLPRPFPLWDSDRRIRDWLRRNTAETIEAMEQIRWVGYKGGGRSVCVFDPMWNVLFKLGRVNDPALAPGYRAIEGQGSDAYGTFSLSGSLNNGGEMEMAKYYPESSHQAVCKWECFLNPWGIFGGIFGRPIMHHINVDDDGLGDSSTEGLWLWPRQEDVSSS